MISTNNQSGQTQPTAPMSESSALNPVPVLDERFEEKDLMFSVEVELNDHAGKVASFKMEHLLAEGKRDENRWRVIKGVQDLIAAAREATVLKLEAKFEASSKPDSEEHDEHGTLSEAEVFPRV